MAIKNGLPAIHPGAFLQEALAELDVSQAEFAQKVGVSAMRISHIINGQRPVSAELALLFGQAFGQTPKYWLNLQSDYDLKIAQKTIGRRLTTLKSYAQAS
jgi:addiction module HigA family antidote